MSKWHCTRKFMPWRAGLGLVVHLVSRASLHHERLSPSHGGTNILTADQV